MAGTGAGWGAGLGAAAVVWVVAQLTVGQVLAARVGEIGELLTARPQGHGMAEPIAVSSDICSMLTRSGLRHGLMLVAFPAATKAADRLRLSFRFEPVGRCHRGRGNAVVAAPVT
ncbi:MAG TPA: hypothetical protein PKE19_05100 [Aestuariivirga sp.]|nr:hypothetical protein [Aestuariivirga sp.]